MSYTLYFVMDCWKGLLEGLAGGDREGSFGVELLILTLLFKEKLLLSFLTFSVLVANPKKLLYTVANPARGLLNREKKKNLVAYASTSPMLLVRRKNKIKNHATHLQGLRSTV